MDYFRDLCRWFFSLHGAVSYFIALSVTLFSVFHDNIDKLRTCIYDLPFYLCADLRVVYMLSIPTWVFIHCIWGNILGRIEEIENRAMLHKYLSRKLEEQDRRR
jgi:hypothetical protein